MKATREHVLDFLSDLPKHPEEQFNEGFLLYRHSAGSNPNQERFFNRIGYSPNTLSTLLYDLKKMHSITEAQIKKNRKQVIQEDPSDIEDLILESVTKSIRENDPENTLKIFLKLFQEHREIFYVKENFDRLHIHFINVISADNNHLQFFDKLMPRINPDLEGLVIPNELLESFDLEKAPVTSEETVKKITEVIISASDEVKQVLKFREEFPFINNPDLPEELKILITDKFSHYHAFAAAHRELFEKIVVPNQNGKKASADAEIFKIAKSAIENFQTDQLIYDELKHYSETGQVLGVHPIFAKRKLQAEIDKMTTFEITKRKGNLENYIRRDTINAEKSKTPENKKKYEDKVTYWKEELDLIKIKIGVSVQ